MHNLFNVADQALAHHISDTEFDASLVHHVLFQDHVLMHEGYLGDSSLTFRHIQRALDRDEDSLLLTAATQGIMIPALREVGGDPMKALLARWEEVYGAGFRILKSENTTIRYLIMKAFDAGIQKGFKPFQWPTDSGRSLEQHYLTVIQRLLQSDVPPSKATAGPDGSSETRPTLPADFHSESPLRTLWKETAGWRIDGVQRAVAQMKSPGVSRTAIVNALGESLGIAATPDGSQIADILKRTEGQAAPKVFLKWIIQCHHIAQANFFAAAVHFPVYSLHQDFVGESLTHSPDDSHQRAECFQVEVTLPPPEKLILIKPNELLEVRSEYGGAYFAAIADWSSSPSGRTRDCVQAALEEYAKRLSRRFSAETLYKVSLSKQKSSLLSELLRPGIEPAANALGDPLKLPLGACVALAGTCWTMGKWFRKRSEYRHTKQTIDVVLPAST